MGKGQQKPKKVVFHKLSWKGYKKKQNVQKVSFCCLSKVGGIWAKHLPTYFSTFPSTLRKADPVTTPVEKAVLNKDTLSETYHSNVEKFKSI